MHYAKALLQWRKLHKLTQEQAAAAAGVALSTYRFWENPPHDDAVGPGANYLQKLDRFHPGVLDLLKRHKLEIQNAGGDG